MQTVTVDLASYQRQLARMRDLEKRVCELEGQTMRSAIDDVIAERARQKNVEGWTPEHDDEHSCGELAQAAACYAYPVPWGVNPKSQIEPPKLWPWDREWWKPKDHRRNMVRAAALIVAEIERIDRAAVTKSEA